jgi:hypothetical protein
MSARKSLVNEILRLRNQKPIKDADYYEVTLLGNEDGTIEIRTQTIFDGYTDTIPRRELRVASLVDPEKMMSALNEIGEPALLVNNAQDFVIFYMFGGHAVIEKSLVEKHFPKLLEPRETAYSHTRGHLVVSSLPQHVVQHAPSKKLRMEILKRDNYKCRVCGRSPKDYVDVELHVHHILPWGKGGVTDEDNLITLCKTCHDGLDPHFEMNLFELIGIDPMRDRLRKDQSRYVEGLKLLHKIVRQAIDKADKDSEI